MESPSYAWRGPKGCGKRTQLLSFLERQLHRIDPHHAGPLSLRKDTWYLNKPTAGGDPEEDDEAAGKSIPYEESCVHLGFDVATMSMSDKVFLQSILGRWTGQQDVCLMATSLATRYLVLYHAHLLTDESVLQLQECLEQYPSFAILLTTELPLCSRLRDFCFELPCRGPDRLLAAYTARAHLNPGDVWLSFFQKTLHEWSLQPCDEKKITEVRSWIYTCLQRNLRWTDVILYWMLALYQTPWLTSSMRAQLLHTLWNAESGSGWVLVTSYRIPILWEHVHLKLARQLYTLRGTLAPPPGPLHQ